MQQLLNGECEVADAIGYFLALRRRHFLGRDSVQKKPRGFPRGLGRKDRVF
jgi:hypothetical protein